jgi:hypothetical protein
MEDWGLTSGQLNLHGSFYAPTSPPFSQRLPVWVRVPERKPDDSWGILGLLSGSIREAKTRVRGKLYNSTLSINFTATPNSLPSASIKQGPCPFQREQRALGELRGAIDRDERGEQSSEHMLSYFRTPTP